MTALASAAVMANPSAALPPGRLLAPGPVGTVDTVAGPGFCTGRATFDPDSSRVGAMAADANGTVWFESGPPDEGLLTKVLSTAATPIVRTGIASSGRHGRGLAGPASGHASASLLAPNRKGGLLLGLPTVVVEYTDGFTAVAGAVAPAGTALETHQSGDGGPLRAARFNHVSAIASDAVGNVYVADDLDGDGGEMAIRFLNRGEGPVTFYAGTPRERMVAPGTLDTIAGGDRSPTGPVVAEAPELAVAGERLYLARTAAGARAEVRMLNLGADPLSTHGVTVAPGDMAAVARVAVRDGAGGASPVPALAGIAADEQGNLFLAEPGNHRVRRVGLGGAVTTLAGTGRPGFDGDDRPANEARLDRPYDVEVGPGGRVYVSDAGNARVRVVDPAGTIRTALGNGTTNRWLCDPVDAPAPGAPGTAGSPGRTGEPKSVAIDAAGNVYVAVAGLAQADRLAPSGSLRPVAGGVCLEPGGCYVGDDAPAGEANLGGLSILEPGPAGGLYVVQETRVRFLNLASAPLTVHGVAIPPGGMATVAGEPPPEAAPPPPSPPSPAPIPTVPPIPTGPPPTTPDGEPAVAESPGVTYTALVPDGDGGLLLADVAQGPFYTGNGSIRHVDRRGAVTTVVDRPGLGPDGEADPKRCCAYPSGLVTDRSGNLYIADTTGRRIWFLNRGPVPVVAHGVPVGPGELEPVAGAGKGGIQDEGITALEARLSAPMGLVLDGVGNLYVADFLEHSVNRIDPGGSITTVAGNGQPGFNGDGLKGPLTALNQPTDVAIDGCGNLLVADSGNDRVRRLNLVPSCPTAARAPAAGGSASWPYAAAGGMVVSALVGTIAMSRRRRRRAPRAPAQAGARGG